VPYVIAVVEKSAHIRLLNTMAGICSRSILFAVLAERSDPKSVCSALGFVSKRRYESQLSIGDLLIQNELHPVKEDPPQKQEEEEESSKEEI
jgi:hypothetical protein